MITYKRPLKASDIYDVSISTLPKLQQNVFWSIGYKSSEMRKIHKPKKNEEPIPLNFGRRPRWNCPVDGEEFEKEDLDDDGENGIDFSLKMSESKTVGTNEPPERRRVPKPTSQITTQYPYTNIHSSKSKNERIPPRRKIPRSRTGSDSPINNWSDIFSPPTKPQPEVGGFRPELKTNLPRRNPQLTQNNPPLQNSELFTSAPTQTTRIYSLPDTLANAKEQSASNVYVQQQHKSRNRHVDRTNTAKRKPTTKTTSASPWDVPSISCIESKTKKKPIYIHLGPSALHRGNQGRHVFTI